MFVIQVIQQWSRLSLPGWATNRQWYKGYHCRVRPHPRSDMPMPGSWFDPTAE